MNGYFHTSNRFRLTPLLEAHCLPNCLRETCQSCARRGMVYIPLRRSMALVSLITSDGDGWTGDGIITLDSDRIAGNAIHCCSEAEATSLFCSVRFALPLASHPAIVEAIIIKTREQSIAVRTATITFVRLIISTYRGGLSSSSSAR